MTLKKNNNKSSNDNSRQFIVLLLYQVLTLIFSLVSSLCLFGGIKSMLTPYAGESVIQSGDGGLIIYSERKNESPTDGFWEKISSECTDVKPYVSCVSRVCTAKINDLTVTIFDVPFYDNKTYSFNHIYGSNVWNKLAQGSVVFSKDLAIKLKASSGSSFNVSFGSTAKTLKFIGECDGSKNGNRKNTGTLFADMFGYFAVVSQQEFDSLSVNGYLCYISNTIDTRDIVSNMSKWFGYSQFSTSSTIISCKALSDRFELIKEINTRKALYLLTGIVSLIISLTLIVFFVKDFFKKRFTSKLLLFIFPVLCVLIWFVPLFVLSRLTVTLFGTLIIFKYSGAFILPLTAGLIFTLISIIGALSMEKKIITNKYYDEEKQISNDKVIWIMNHYATTPENGPLPRHYYLAKRFVQKGYKVVIFASNQLHATDTEVEVKKGKYAEIDKGDIKFIFLKTLRYKGNGVKRILNMISFYFKLLHSWSDVAYKYGKPSIIIGSSAHLLTCSAAKKIAIKNEVPYITEVRDLWPEELFTVGKVKENSLFGKMLTRLERNIYIESDAIVFTKEGDVDHIKEMKWDTAQGGKIDLNKCFYINNGVDFEEWNFNLENNKYSVNKNETDFCVGYAGSIRPMNSIDFIVEAASILKDDKTVKFYIAGSGSLLEEMINLAKSKKLDNIIFTGYLEKKYVPSFLSKMDLNILIYSKDNYNWSRGNSSNKLFEYMASGKPIISNVKMGYSILNKYKCGIELEEYTPNKLVEAILNYKNMNKKEYNGYCKNASKASKQFDFDNLSDSYLLIINKLIDLNNKEFEETRKEEERAKIND